MIIKVDTLSYSLTFTELKKERRKLKILRERLAEFSTINISSYTELPRTSNRKNYLTSLMPPEGYQESRGKNRAGKQQT